MALFQTVPAPMSGWRSNPLDETIIINGIDLTGAAFLLEVRDRRDGGALRATLTTQVSAVEGVYLSSVETVEGVPVSTLQIRFDEATMEAMPLPTEVGDDLTIVWGMHITPSGGTKFMAFDGPFTIKASAPA